MSSQTATLSLRRHDSAELTPIDISSSGPTSKFYARCSKNGKGWGVTPPGTLQDEFADEEYINSVCKSWLTDIKMLITWRIMIFTYMLATLITICCRAGFEQFQLSMLIYAIEVVASFFGIVSCVLFVSQSKKEIRQRKGYLTPPLEPGTTAPSLHLGSRLAQVGKRLGKPIQIHFNRTVMVMTATLIQNCCAVVLFWDFIFWTKLRNTEFIGMSDHTNYLLLHLYNMVFVVFELLLGCTMFRVIYFVPGVAFMAGVFLCLVNASTGGGVRDGGGGGVVFIAEAINSHSREGAFGPFAQLSVIFVLVCALVILIQRMRSKFTRKG